MVLSLSLLYNSRDGSACLSYHIDPSGKKWAIPHRRIEWSEEEYFVRNRQLRERCHEVCQALNLATLLNDEPEKCENFEGDTNNEFFAMFKNTMDLSNPVMCGHSFGGATTLMALAAEPRFKVGIVLDGWLFPLRDEKDLAAKVKGKPIMFVNAESFLNEENLKKMETFRQEAGAESMSSQDIERICYYIKGSVHQNHIDAPFVIKVSVILVIRKRARESTTLNFQRIKYQSKNNFFVRFSFFGSALWQRLSPATRLLSLSYVLKIRLVLVI